MPKVALLFPGQGAQYPRMAAGLYRRCEPFTATMDQAFELLGTAGDELRAEWLSDRPGDLLDDVTRAQPLLYAVDCALGHQVLRWGVAPVALLGHSVGEMAAATVSGVFSLADGMRVMRNRMTHFAHTPPGGMLAVAAAAADVSPHLTGQVAVAAVNSPRQTLVAGKVHELAEVERALVGSGLTCKRVRARQGFHSPAVSIAVARSADTWRSVRLSRPGMCLYSSQVGGILPGPAATDPIFWTRQPATPVRFWPALEQLLEDHEHQLVLVETGPGQGLSVIARRHPAVRSGRSCVVPLSPARPGPPGTDREVVRRAAEQIAGAQ